MAGAFLKPRHTPGARVDELGHGHVRLSLPAGEATSYRLAQLDDYAHLPRGRFPHHTLTLNLLARTSATSLPGTWGFGLWNDPFGLSLGFGGGPFRLPALPNAAWFFGASRENHLSFRDDLPAQGFLAQTFRSPQFHPRLGLAGLALPFSRRWARRQLGRVIDEDGVVLSVDPGQWHRYRLEWSLTRVVWEVDDARVYESAVSPNSPLGVVIWIDNQYAAFTPQGRVTMGVLANEAAWLEIKELEIK